MNKICKDCNIDKDINEFSKQKGGKDGYKTICKKCYYVRYGAKIKEYNKNYIIENKDKRKETLKNYRDNNKDKLNEYNKLYAEQNKDMINAKAKTYRENNKYKIQEYINKYRNKKYIENHLYKLSCNIRNLISMTFKNNGYKKNSKTANILGCSYEDFLIYLKNQFEDWMTLENHGIYTGNYNETWQIDHICPISNATKEDEVIKLNHYTNLRPLCSRKNLEKSNK